ncbi:tripartite tricarboxylate transporter family receptor [Variibacter gotjawalensis]|uniref:Tripartite tricarboxylate transporter family receptor n=2 Tax=Variibacter gotjawalensis TaxID=1333996 RepID=A0A0S3PY28_9BRAD|nr:tripartite-type tricarboxylate transporter receptor subunit TctC [Variibacter gotjawalensis]RZS48598.1 tripartite-type tricarboxylate transporter receptor subunit TctC [Variibacter gotjawalensis]BAT60860.1 tripartite tricarboxylate transporter family receptor [Variibacter gotjawalensis]
MKLSRRVAMCAVAFAAVSIAQPAVAQEYPNRIIKWVVGYPAGGATDIFARLIGQYLSEKLGQQVIIENRPGAGNNIGTEAVINSAPDGYTVLLTNPANSVNATLYRKLNFNFMNDTVPIAGIARVPNVMEVHPSVPAKTVKEFIDYAKANPGKINMASSGNGTSIHLSGELFKFMTGVQMQHVPYRGSSPALTDLLAGQVQVMFDNLPASIAHIKANSLRPLAVTTAQRSKNLPDVPTVAETVPGYEASAFFGMSAPKGTPPAVIKKLNDTINAALKDPNILARIEELGGIPMGGTPEEFGAVVKSETEKWAKVVEFSGVKVD